MHLNQQGFTLTELLMGVLMISILSAAVLPKYTKMVDSFRVQEAQELMVAIRNEQVSRCLLNKQYTTQANHLTILPSSASGSTYTTSNFVYDLSRGNGITATSLTSGYVLEIPSYKDGRICCDNCSDEHNGSYLSKSYDICAELANFQEEDGACYPLSE